jgi:selenide,water dikinase
VTNAGARAGDALVLTKPVGVGVVVTAAKRGRAAPRQLEEAIGLMGTSNRSASKAAVEAGAHGMTDVTGFGLLGHLHELAAASGLAATVEADAVPVLGGALELVADDALVCGGSARNRSGAEDYAEFAPSVDEPRRRVLTDAVTSGGLLVALPAGRAAEVPGPVIGCLHSGVPGQIRIQ